MPLSTRLSIKIDEFWQIYTTAYSPLPSKYRPFPSTPKVSLCYFPKPKISAATTWSVSSRVSYARMVPHADLAQCKSSETCPLLCHSSWSLLTAEWLGADGHWTVSRRGSWIKSLKAAWANLWVGFCFSWELNCQVFGNCI
jgi:hypothetical protein